MGSHTAELITIAIAILGVLITILGYIIKATIKWTIVSVKLTSIETTVTHLMDQLVEAVTRDNTFETRLQLLERERNAK